MPPRPGLGRYEPTISGDRIEFAHLLRGIAAASVVASHFGNLFWSNPQAIADLIAYPSLPSIIQPARQPPLTDFGFPLFWGHLGVALFFLISGFVIPFSVAGSTPIRFAIARAFRIWPTYLCGLAVAIACIAFNSHLYDKTFPFSPAEMLTNALIIPRWPTWTRSIDGIIWTLEVELVFYTICAATMPLIRAFDTRLFLLALPAVPVAIVVGFSSDLLLSRGVSIYALAHWASSMLIYVSYMLCGTAFFYHHERRLGRIQLIMLHSLLLVALMVSMRAGILAPQGWSAPLAYLIAFGVFALAYFLRGRIMVVPTCWRDPLSRLADVSYPLYAVHGVLGYTILSHAIASGLSSLVAITITLGSVLTIAILVHGAVEKPTRDYGRRLATSWLPASSGQEPPGR